MIDEKTDKTQDAKAALIVWTKLLEFLGGDYAKFEASCFSGITPAEMRVVKQRMLGVPSKTIADPGKSRRTIEWNLDCISEKFDFLGRSSVHELMVLYLRNLIDMHALSEKSVKQPDLFMALKDFVTADILKDESVDKAMRIVKVSFLDLDDREQKLLAYYLCGYPAKRMQIPSVKNPGKMLAGRSVETFASLVAKERTQIPNSQIHVEIVSRFIRIMLAPVEA